MAPKKAEGHIEAGDLALAFVNTLLLRRGEFVDSVASPEALRRWLADAGVLTADATQGLVRSPPDARLLLSEAQRLRACLREAVAAFSRGAPLPPTLLPALNHTLERRSTSSRAVEGEEGIQLVERDDSAHPAAPLAPLAEAAIHLFAEAKPTRVRQCHADDCVRWFLDGSRNGKRKWCSMARCGNRAKVAAHYRRSGKS